MANGKGPSEPSMDGVDAEVEAEAADADGAVTSASSATPQRSVISQKELAREYRRQAYQRAKAYRAADPKYAQMKERVKLRQRELYQVVKARRKAGAAEEKKIRAAQKTEERAAVRRERRQGLMSAVRKEPLAEAKGQLQEGEASTAQASSEDEINAGEPEVGLQVAITSALKNKRVKELLQRVRLESEQPDVIANEAFSSGQVVPLSRSRRAKEGSPG